MCLTPGKIAACKLNYVYISRKNLYPVTTFKLGGVFFKLSWSALNRQTARLINLPDFLANEYKYNTNFIHGKRLAH